MPTRLFEPHPDVPLRERLLDIGEAFFAMIMTPEAIAGHRILCSPQITGSPMPAVFWEAGPQRVQSGFTALLERRIAAGELEIDDPTRAAAQFFTLLKGEPHAQAGVRLLLQRPPRHAAGRTSPAWWTCSCAPMRNADLQAERSPALSLVAVTSGTACWCTGTARLPARPGLAVLQCTVPRNGFIPA